MRKPKKIPKKIERIFKESEVLSLLEHMNENIRIIAEGHESLERSIADFREEVETRFQSIDERFRMIDERFQSMDERFKVIDERFQSIDERFDQIDRRFEQVDKRFEQMDLRFQHSDQGFKSVFEYLSRIEDELTDLKRKVDSAKERSREEVMWKRDMERRVKRLERLLEGKRKKVASAR